MKALKNFLWWLCGFVSAFVIAVGGVAIAAFAVPSGVYFGYNEDLLDAETAKNVLIVPASNHAVPSITTKLPEINKVLTEELENIYTGVKTVQQGMDDAQARAEALLAK